MERINKATATKVLELVLYELKDRDLLDMEIFGREIGCETFDEIVDQIQGIKPVVY
jgi:hypothetical protein